MTEVNTKKAERRELDFKCTGCLKKELDRIDAAHRAGTLTTTGNWTAAQNLEHCARFWSAAIDGFPPDVKPPLVVKWIVGLLFKGKAVKGGTAPAGIKPPPAFTRHFEPAADTDYDAAMAHLRRQVARTDNGEKFDHPSPLFGKLTHEQWTNVQLGHVQLHLGFLRPG